MISMTGDMPPYDEAAAVVALEQPELTAAVAVASNAAAELVELPHQQQVSFSSICQTFVAIFDAASTYIMLRVCIMI